MRMSYLVIWLVLISLQIRSQDAVIPNADSTSAAKPVFNRFFLSKTLRLDYVLSGDYEHTHVALWQMKEEPFWGGPKQNLTDPWNSGNFRYSVYDAESGELLYRKGFSTLFEEYQGTGEAKKRMRAYPMTATFPYPLGIVRFELDRREFQTGLYTTIFSLVIQPDDYFIVQENTDSCVVIPLLDQGDPANHLDILFLAEGYTQGQMEKFREDATRMMQYFLATEPYAGMADRISFRAVETPSRDSGVDIPGKQEYRNTAFNSSFYTFDSDRYLTTPDTWSMRDAAANAPYDQIIILNNSPVYGGGGFYNHYCQSTVDHPLSEIVAIHEFGHAFGGLADEYVGGVNYDGFYNLALEPWEPNITTLVDFPAKWQQMISDTVPIPTPREPAYRQVVGVYEGGGYMARGIYSPFMNCRMKDNEAKGFCQVCRLAIREKILFYSDEGIDF